MFTGIIRTVGKIQDIQEKNGQRRFKIWAENIVKNKKVGQSLAVNGVCLTIVDLDNDCFLAEAIPETLRKTTLGLAKVGDLVNLEPSLTLSEGLDGHLLLGHVDDMGKIIKIIKEGKSKILTVKFPSNLRKFLALKGSIAINGVSLTISAVQKNTFRVSLIPYTLKTTNLERLRIGDQVNLEIDMVARYVERMMKKDRQVNKKSNLP